MKKRNDSRSGLVRLLLGVADLRDADPNKKQNAERLITRIEKAFPVTCNEKRILNTEYSHCVEYKYSDIFTQMVVCLHNLYIKKTPIRNLSVNTFLNRCETGTISFTDISAFFSEFYHHIKESNIDNKFDSNLKDIREVRLVALNLDDFIRTSNPKISKDTLKEIKKKLLFYCFSTRKAQFRFLKKKLDELLNPIKEL